MASKKRGRSDLAPQDAKVLEKYAHGSIKFNTKKIKHVKLRKTMEETQEKLIESAKATAATEVLLPSEAGYIDMDDGRKTFKVTQKELRKHVDINTAKNIFDFTLTNFGPYRVRYSRNGRYMLFCGAKGHIAAYDCHQSRVASELQLQETVHDVSYLHNETFFAAAQHKYTYIYDGNGVELHCLRDHERTYKLDFLPYHFLLTSVGHSGWIKWQDVSVGQYIAGYQMSHGPTRVLKHNPVNAVSHVGHNNGVVSLWSPAVGKALVTMFCHKSPVTDLAVDIEGRYMTTAGLDGYMKVWDLRKFSLIHAYKTSKPASSLDISERGLVAMSIGRQVQVLKNAFTSPIDVTYLQHTVSSPNAALVGGGVAAVSKMRESNISISNIAFRPLEDVLGIGHSVGVSAIAVPGAGEPNFDSFENNPYINRKQRREAEIQSLLSKLTPDMINLDASFIGSVDKDQETLRVEHNEVFHTANEKVKKERMKMRGRSKISAKLRKKQKNVVDAQTIKLRDKLKKEREAREKLKGAHISDEREKLGALKRFV